MSGQAVYSCTALVGTNKTGVIKPGPDGYYEMVLGALDFYNSAGAFYDYQSAKSLFEESSGLMRRISNGNLKGEQGHPKMLPGMTKRDYLTRILSVYEDCISHHIRQVVVDKDRVIDNAGRKCIAVIGYVKPAGPHAAALQAALENPHENVNFSIRSLTNDYYDSRGQCTKQLQEIVTWDWVTEPGISVANKYKAPSLETLSKMSFSFEDIQQVVEHNASLRKMGVAVESMAVSAEDVIALYGWDHPIHKGNNPPSMKW